MAFLAPSMEEMEAGRSILMFSPSFAGPAKTKNIVIYIRAVNSGSGKLFHSLDTKVFFMK